VWRFLAGAVHAQTPMYAVQPYLDRLMDNNHYRSLSATSWYYRWPGWPPFPTAVSVAPDRTTVPNGQCVAFARKVSNRDVATRSWQRDRPLVVNGCIRTDIAAGTIIATIHLWKPLRLPPCAAGRLIVASSRAEILTAPY